MRSYLICRDEGRETWILVKDLKSGEIGWASKQRLSEYGLIIYRDRAAAEKLLEAVRADEDREAYILTINI